MARHGGCSEPYGPETYRRPPTSCAHRLRKPGPRVRASDALCRAAGSGLRAPTRAPEHPVGWPLIPALSEHFCSQGISARCAGPCGTAHSEHATTPLRDTVTLGYRGFRHARFAVTAVGLGRRTIDEPGRLPSDRPGPCGPSGLDHACCSRAWPRPAPCRLPRSRPASSKPGGSLQTISVSRLAPCSRLTSGLPPALAVRSEKDASLRLLQPTSLHEHPADCSIPGCGFMMPFGIMTPCGVPEPPVHPGPKARRSRGWDLVPACVVQRRTNQPGGASLDGEPPASASAATRYMETMYTRPSAVLVEPRSTAPLSPSLPVRAFSAANRACDEASDVLLHEKLRTWVDPIRPTARSCPQASGQAASPSPGPARSTSAAASSKDDHLGEPGRLPSTRAPKSPPVSLLACSWLSPLRAGSSAASPRSFPSFREGRACQLDLGFTLPVATRDQDQALLVDFCNPNNPRAQPRIQPIPVLGARGLRPTKLSPGSSVTGDRRLAPCHVRHVAPGTSRPRVKERYDRQPRFHGPGAGRLSPQASLVHACALHRRHSRLSPVTDFRRDNVRELRPNPIRSGTSCHGLVAPLEGDSSGVYARPPRNPAP